MFKKILKVVLGILGLLLIAILVYLGFNYHSDIALEELKGKYMHENSQFITIKDMPVHFCIDGQGEETIVLLHGTGSSLHTWEAWVQLLKDKYRIVRMDLPAFGLTGPNPQNRHDLIFYNIFLETFFDKIGLDKFHLAGNSFGGFLAWNYALLHPGEVEHLVLLNSSGYPLEPKKLPLGFRLAQNKRFSQYLEKVTPKSIIKKTVYAAYEDDSKVSQETIDRYFELLLREGNRKGMMQKMQQIKHDNHHKIKEIKTPTLILWGEKDAIIPSQHAYQFHKDIKGAEFIMYHNIGHLPMEEIPKRSAKDLLDFLNHRNKKDEVKVIQTAQ